MTKKLTAARNLSIKWQISIAVAVVAAVVFAAIVGRDCSDYWRVKNLQSLAETSQTSEGILYAGGKAMEYVGVEGEGAVVMAGAITRIDRGFDKYRADGVDPVGVTSRDVFGLTNREWSTAYRSSPRMRFELFMSELHKLHEWGDVELQSHVLRQVFGTDQLLPAVRNWPAWGEVFRYWMYKDGLRIWRMADEVRRVGRN